MAIDKDVTEIISVIHSSMLATHKGIYPGEDMQETFDNYTLEKVLHYINDYNYFVAEEDSQIVGCVLMKKGKMRSLYVLPTFMGKGIGRKLVEIAEKSAKEEGFNEVWLWASLIAHDFYKHLGYEDVKEIENRDGLVLHIEMKKIL